MKQTIKAAAVLLALASVAILILYAIRAACCVALWLSDALNVPM